MSSNTCCCRYKFSTTAKSWNNVSTCGKLAKNFLYGTNFTSWLLQSMIAHKTFVGRRPAQPGHIRAIWSAFGSLWSSIYSWSCHLLYIYIYKYTSLLRAVICSMKRLQLLPLLRAFFSVASFMRSSPVWLDLKLGSLIKLNQLGISISTTAYLQLSRFPPLCLPLLCQLPHLLMCEHCPLFPCSKRLLPFASQLFFFIYSFSFQFATLFIPLSFSFSFFFQEEMMGDSRPLGFRKEYLRFVYW